MLPNFIYVGAFIVGYLRENPCIGDEPIDIEDLVNIGKTYGP